jgi:formate-dependent nitrite reductase membrane component NrfD
MSSHSQAVDDDFRLGPRQQTAWGTHMASAFFFGEVGSGLFLVSLVYGFVLGMVLGLAMVLFGKGGGHSLHLGQRTRGWRAFAKIGTSWVSRGLLAITVFTSFGALHVLQTLYGVLPAPLALLVKAIAAAACLVIMVYQGFAMSHSSAITLWSTGLMPVTSLTYALLNGILLTLALGANAPFLADQPGTVWLLKTGVIGLLLFGVVTILSMLHAARFGSEGGRESVRLLLQTDYAAIFLPVVMGVGLILPGLLLRFGGNSSATMIAAAAAGLAGCFTFRVLVFKAGTYDPVMKFGRQFKR